MKIFALLSRSVAALAALVAIPGTRAQDRAALDQILASGVDDFSVQGQEARAILEGLGAAYHFPVVVDPDVQGTLTFEVHHATVATVFDAVCQPKGWSWEVSDHATSAVLGMPAGRGPAVPSVPQTVTPRSCR